MHRLLALLLIVPVAAVALAGAQKATPEENSPCVTVHSARMVGHIESKRLVECSGMDASLVAKDLFWAINDGGHGPFIYALGRDGQDRGRVKIAGADNRDWEGLDTFMWQGEPMILIADFGDNRRQHATHTLYVIQEPRLPRECAVLSGTVSIAWKLVFAYPDGRHDAEGVAVDRAAGEVLVVTKRDKPPLLFALPLKASDADSVLTARFVAPMNRIPEPTAQDLRQAYGAVRSQPTAIDLSPDGSVMAVLTYKHAYLFGREEGASWTTVLGRQPIVIQLPLPEDCRALAQREAICFSTDGASLLVTSEGDSPGIFQLPGRTVR